MVTSEMDSRVLFKFPNRVQMFSDVLGCTSRSTGFPWGENSSEAKTAFPWRRLLGSTTFLGGAMGDATKMPPSSSDRIFNQLELHRLATWGHALAACCSLGGHALPDRGIRLWIFLYWIGSAPITSHHF